MHKIFDLLLSPVRDYLSTHGAKIDKISESEKLFFADFSLKLLFAFLTGIGSLRSLVLSLSSCPASQGLGFLPTPYSTLKDGFGRFDSKYFRQMYEFVLQSFDWSKVKGFSELGTLCAIDGSFFPTLIQSKWTSYKETANSCKLHLCFELNRMIATELLVTSGNTSERSFLIAIAQKGVTYIADRGYFSFELAQKLHELEAFFVLRIKSNILFSVQKTLDLTHAVTMPTCFSMVKDCLITFNNDTSGIQYRLVCFIIGKKHFKICTNRLDISTLEIMMLYAFRWQIELMFKFVKRTINGLHLYNHTRNGVEIQLYLLIILALLLLRFKQTCQKIKHKMPNNIDTEPLEPNKFEKFISYFGNEPALFIKDIAQNLYCSWKISKNFLLRLIHSINKTLDNQLINDFAHF